VTRRAEILAARRDLLLARSAYLRADLQYEATGIGRRLRLVDRAVAFGQSGSGRALIVGGAVLLALSGPGRILKVAGRLIAVWPLVRPLLSLVKPPADGVR
jgi:hypothetical protein